MAVSISFVGETISAHTTAKKLSCISGAGDLLIKSEHWLYIFFVLFVNYRSCVDTYLVGEACPKCKMPSHAKDVMENKQLSAAVVVIKQLDRILGDVSSYFLPNRLYIQIMQLVTYSFRVNI